MNTAILFISFFVLILLAVPIGYAIGMSVLLTLVISSSIPIKMLAQNAVAGVDSFPLMAIPFFMLAGNLMSSGGIAKRLVNFAELCVGAVTGGLAMVTTLTCMFFGAISGSAVATTSAVGSFMIPGMEKKGYDKDFSAALVAASGTIGVIIPPSVPFVIYGVVSGTSIADMFKAGVLPGIMMGVALMIASYSISKKRGFVGTKRHITVTLFFKTFLDAIWALLSPVIILGGIYAGFFTPTEAAVVSVVYSVLIGRFVYRELDNQGIYQALKGAIVVNGATTFMVGLSMAFASYLAMEQVPATLSDAITSLSTNKILVLIIINLLLVAIGSVVDAIPATIILTPILLPIVVGLGMHPVTFGIVITVNLAIGYVTPPYGINLFVASAISGVPMGRMLRHMGHFLVALFVVLLLLTYIWPLTTFVL